MAIAALRLIVGPFAAWPQPTASHRQCNAMSLPASAPPAEPGTGDAASRLRSRRLMQLIIAAMLGFGTSAASDLITDDWSNVGVHLPTLLALSLALWAWQRGRQGLASALLLATVTAAISLLVWNNAGLRDPAMLAYPGILVFASTMTDRRLFRATLVVILAFVALVTAANVQGWHVNAVPTHSVSNLIDVFIVLSIDAFVIWLLAGDLQTALADLRAENARVRMSQARIEFLATHDVLTGLPNRALAQDRFELAAAQADRQRSGVAVIFLDLDDFKHVNDSLGHPQGDKLLRVASRRVTGALRAGDTVCRQGGDEFLILLADMRDSEHVADIALKLLAELALPFSMDGDEVSTSASLGIAMYPGDGRNFDELLKKADMAMYGAKAAGRNTLRFFADEMNAGLQEHVRLVAGLRTAIAQGEMMLHYQPQFELRSGRVVGAEALLRWRHPTLGLVPPAQFIRVAEQSGLVVEIGAWALREACLQMKAWHDQGLAHLVVSVNVSPVQFQRDSIERDIVNALETSGLPARYLELELTESLLIKDSSHLSDLLLRLRALGVSLAIDDFGTGYSNLGYLKRFEVGRLKIDQSFIRRLPTDKHDEAIVRAIIQMAQNLQLGTIAEGVETVAALARLVEMGCNEGQGLLWAPALPADEFEAYLRRQQTAGWMPRLA
jgi:diguanylate cyclase (GGDEF)-like protein